MSKTSMRQALSPRRLLTYRSYRAARIAVPPPTASLSLAAEASARPHAKRGGTTDQMPPIAREPQRSLSAGHQPLVRNSNAAPPGRPRQIAGTLPMRANRPQRDGAQAMELLKADTTLADCEPPGTSTSGADRDAQATAIQSTLRSGTQEVECLIALPTFAVAMPTGAHTETNTLTLTRASTSRPSKTANAIRPQRIDSWQAWLKSLRPRNPISAPLATEDADRHGCEHYCFFVFYSARWQNLSLK